MDGSTAAAGIAAAGALWYCCGASSGAPKTVLFLDCGESPALRLSAPAPPRWARCRCVGSLALAPPRCRRHCQRPPLRATAADTCRPSADHRSHRHLFSDDTLYTNDWVVANRITKSIGKYCAEKLGLPVSTLPIAH